MNHDQYSMSFTTGGLFHHESVKLAGIFLELGNWNSVRDAAIAGNLLQTRTLNTLKRVCGEIISRLKTLNQGELEFLVECNNQEQGHLLWVAVCRRYKFIADFAIEVLRENYLTLKIDLKYEDFDSFFNRKSEWHQELDHITQATRNKLRQVLFRILRDVDILTDSNVISPAIPSKRLLKLITQNNHNDVLCFPVFESDLKDVMS